MRGGLTLLPLGIFVALILLFWIGLGLNPRELNSPLVGQSVPEFSVPDLMHAERPLTEQSLMGHVSVVNVWASWCVSCRAEHQQILALAKQGVQVIGLNYKDEFEDAVDYLQENGNPYQAIGFDHKGEVGIEWGVYATPETFVIDRHGVVRHKHTGPIRPATLEQELMPLIAQLEAE